jgi:hypothetical protein
MTKLLLSLTLMVFLGALHQSSGQLRTVDWKNFAYPWYPADTNPPYKTRTLRLRNGEFEVQGNSKRKIENLSMSLSNVSYVDVTGDGKEDAIVTLGGVETFNSFTGCIFIYTMHRGRLRLSWRHEIGDRAAGGLRRVKAGARTITVEQYDNQASAMCCPKKYVRSVYSWTGRGFVKIRSQILENEYGNATFLGYADSSL